MVAPNLPVDVLLGTDVYQVEGVREAQGWAVWTQLKRRQMEIDLTETPKRSDCSFECGRAPHSSR